MTKIACVFGTSMTHNDGIGKPPHACQEKGCNGFYRRRLPCEDFMVRARSKDVPRIIKALRHAEIECVLKVDGYITLKIKKELAPNEKENK